MGASPSILILLLAVLLALLFLKVLAFLLIFVIDSLSTILRLLGEESEEAS